MSKQQGEIKVWLIITLTVLFTLLLASVYLERQPDDCPLIASGRCITTEEARRMFK